jgi:hypothetical protein
VTSAPSSAARADHTPAAQSLGYSEADLLRLSERAGGNPVSSPEAIRRIIDEFQYLEDWRSNYRIQSVRSSLHSPRITCIDAAILSYGLLELCCSDVKRALLPIHRRDPKTGEECGHCVTLYWASNGRIGAISKSSYKGLGHREPVFSDEAAVATSYARAYVDMAFQPLYFGVTTLEEAVPDLDWRLHMGDLNLISERLQAAYQYGFEVGY